MPNWGISHSNPGSVPVCGRRNKPQITQTSYGAIPCTIPAGQAAIRVRPLQWGNPPLRSSNYLKTSAGWTGPVVEPAGPSGELQDFSNSFAAGCFLFGVKSAPGQAGLLRDGSGPKSWIHTCMFLVMHWPHYTEKGHSVILSQGLVPQGQTF